MPRGRNPYGSEGGYVVSRRSRRDRGMGMDYARGGRGRDREMDMHYGRGMMRDPQMYGMRGMDYEMDYGMDYEMDYAQGGRGGSSGGRSGGGLRGGSGGGSRGGRSGGSQGGRDNAMDYGYGMDYGYDYEMGGLDEEEIEEFSEKLMKKVDEKDREMLKKEKVIKKAQDMGIKFEEFTPHEFYATTLMMYTDYCKVLGNASLDIYLRLAKAWIMDEDAEVKGGEKLAVYYDEIVGE